MALWPLVLALCGPVQPCPAATGLVTTTADSGPGSLRQAILDANANAGFDAIHFQLAGAGPHLIEPLTALPAIQEPVSIDGTTQPGYAGSPVIELSGASAGAGMNGLLLIPGGSTIRGLAINRFSGDGVRIESGGTNIIAGNYLGVAPDGATARGNSKAGVSVNRSTGNRIGGPLPADRNVISGGNLTGVIIAEPGSAGNLVQGNYIGTTASGNANLGNQHYGVLVLSANGNSVGGPTAGARNVISGNDLSGVVIQFGASNVVQGNLIGTDAMGTGTISNGLDGVTIFGGTDNLVGGTDSATGNVISGNSQRGVAITFPGADRNVVAGNLIGTDLNGRAALPNRFGGVAVYLGSSNVIGGTVPAARNVISGNGQSGVLLLTNATTANRVHGNYIGVDITGTNALGNLFDGISIDGAPNNWIGGSTASAGNVISGNHENGVEIKNPGATGNIIQGNRIGTDAAGRRGLPNRWAGVRIESPANQLGGSTPSAGNLISGNGESGVFLVGASCRSNGILGNLIGTDFSGAFGLENAIAGVGISNAPQNIIGGATSTDRNVISGNRGSGIYLAGNASTGNQILGNRIGTDPSGTASVPNGAGGIYLYSAPSNHLGIAVPGGGNLISGNRQVGISLGDPGCNGNRIQANSVGTQIDGRSPLGNQWHNIELISGSTNTVIGGDEVAANRIAFAQTAGYDGVRIRAGAVRVSVQGNTFFGNGGSSVNGLAIDLGTDGPDTNDNCDGDGGANLGQNYPVLSACVTDGSRTRIQGTLNSVASRNYHLHFYASPACDPSNRGEGELYLGAASTSIGASCSASFTVTVPSPVPTGRVVAATASDDLGNTSEFSTCAISASAPALDIATLPEGRLGITWPATATGFLLTETANLNPPIVWQLVTSPPVILTNSTFYWAGPATNTMRFFQLMLD